jgi:hypothetical protein
MPFAERSKTATQLSLCALIALMLLYAAFDGIRAGWYEWMPGAMSRHRDAMAVAITAVAYGKWQGYASYRSVNRTLREHGLSVSKGDLDRVGATHYFEIMTGTGKLKAALKAASTLETPEAEGMYFSQDEKGMALLYTASFALFGISPGSWYWLYIGLYALSLVAACFAFYRRSEILFFLLVVVCVHALVADLLPAIPRQDISVIHGNRFIGTMGIVASFHLMFLMTLRIRPTAGQILAAIFQTGVIFLVVNARMSALWLPIAVTLFWTSLSTAWLVRRTRHKKELPRPTSWPMGVLALGFAALLLHQQIGVDPAFHDGRAQGGHVVWHCFITAVHNNPNRTDRYGIPAEYPVYDDQVAYTLFGREIAARGEPLSKYLVGDSDWVYRTDDPVRDFRWAAYDGVQRDIFLRTIAADPGYAIYSFVVQQPRSALTIMLGPDFMRAPQLRRVVPILVLVLGFALTVLSSPMPTAAYLPALAAASAAALLPVLSIAVVELRVVEIFYVLLLDAIMAVAVVAAILGRSLLSRIR